MNKNIIGLTIIAVLVLSGCQRVIYNPPISLEKEAEPVVHNEGKTVIQEQTPVNKETVRDNPVQTPEDEEEVSLDDLFAEDENITPPVIPN